MFSILFAAMLVQAPAAQASPDRPAPVPDVRRLTVAAPTVLAEIDTAKVQGDPIGLAWRSDGAIYLRVTQGKDKTRHYQITMLPAMTVAQTEQVPKWAAEYWEWKAAITAPEDPSFKIDVTQTKERLRTTNVSSGGELAGMGNAAAMGSSGGGDNMSQATAVSAANSAILSDVVRMRIKDEVIGEWVNENPVPGLRFGWAPAPMGVLAYAEQTKGRLTLIDHEGHRLQVPGTSNALLPAWSLDGRRIVFLEKKNSKLYILKVANVGSTGQH